MSSGTQTKTALLEAAKQLVGERGYAGVSVRELTSVSGANLGAVNYHFGSREKLLNQAILEFFLEWGARVGQQGPADPEAEPLGQLAARARPMVEGIADAQPAFVVFLEALLQGRRSPELHRQLVEHYAEQRRRAVEAMDITERGSALPARTREVVASYMLAVVDGLQLQALLDPEAIPTGDELATLYESLAASARATAGSTGATDPESETK
ncbi:MAG TPA: TetR/AcrR family transcriptional regulator [Solirubrobacteraceae bacterium]|jgi:AcrR family transcriptional regulator|nr:TetR/AcrR family transcriptional regulator [Solirubrobacteraceae bacterium]